MSKQVNYPYQTTTLSANGSAEVIARGITNDYITTWSHNTTTIGSWDNVVNFPTVVRTGNFVWCWYREYDHRAIYILIDIVPDPQEEYQLGNNIAYPALLNGSVGEIQYPAQSTYVRNVGDNGKDPMSSTLITDGPYYPLTVGNKNIHTTGTTSGYKAGFWSNDRSYKEIVADKWGRTSNVWGGFATANATTIPWMIGWGTRQRLLTSTSTNDGDSIYGIFAPFATYEQFQTLYGAEKDWIFNTYGSAYKTLFGPTYDTFANSGTDPGVYYTNTADIENDYPFTVEAMQPQTKYRDVAGDTTGDGIDNTPSFEAALAGYAVATITKCDGFPEDLIPGLDMEAINKKLNDAKAAIESAIASTGLLDLEKKLEGLKADIIDKFPKATEVLNFIEALIDLDLNTATKAAIDKLKEEWKFIDNIDEFVDGIIDDISNFDICSTIGLKGKTAADGSLVNKPASPSIPDKAIEEPEPSSYVPTQSKETAQTTPAAAVGITPKALEDAKKEYDDKWKQLSEDSQFSWGKELQGYDGPIPNYEAYTGELWIEGPNEGKPKALYPGDQGTGLLNDSDNVQVTPIETIDGIPMPPIVDGITDPRFIEGGDTLPPVIIPLPPTLGGSPDALPELTPGKKVESQPIFKSGAEWEKRLREIESSKDFQDYASAVNNKVDPRNQFALPGDPVGEYRGGMSQESIDKLKKDLSEVLIPVYNYRFFKERLNFFKKKLHDSIHVDGRRGDYFPTTDYEIAEKWDLGTIDISPVGAIIGPTFGTDNDWEQLQVAEMTQENYDALAGVDAEFITALKKYFFTEEGVRLQQKIMMGQDPPFSEKIQLDLLDALEPDDNEGDPVNDNVDAVDEYNPEDVKNIPGRVKYSYTSGTSRRFKIQNKLMNILKASAKEKKYTIEIFSGGQIPKSEGGVNGVNRWGNTVRHDNGYAADIRVYNEKGRRLSAASTYYKDILNLKEFITILLKNGITSVGADSDYMNGNIHVDIANEAFNVPKACWGQGPKGSKRIYAPHWLSSTFDSNVT